MNWADLVIIGAIILFALSGYAKGAIKQIGEFTSLILAIILSVRFYESVGAFILSKTQINVHFANLAGLFVVWMIVQLIFNITFYFLYPLIPEPVRNSKINKFTGAVPGLLFGAVLASLVVIILSVAPIQASYKDEVEQSYTGKFIIANSEGFKGYVTNLAGGAINEAIDFLTVKPNSGETVDLGFKVSESELSVDEASEQAMLDLVNKERTSRGLKPLKMDEDLLRLARAHSKDMFLRGYFAHVNPDGQDPFDRMKEAGIDFKIAGENLALAPNVDLAHEGLMNSPGHRANILTGEYGQVGIGCIDGGSYGKMFSQEFTE